MEPSPLWKSSRLPPAAAASSGPGPGPRPGPGEGQHRGQDEGAEESPFLSCVTSGNLLNLSEPQCGPDISYCLHGVAEISNKRVQTPHEPGN